MGVNDASIDEYVTIKKIGHGSYGSVNLVRCKQDGRLYVMKVVKNITATPFSTVEAVQEVNVLESLRHPNIVTFKEAFLSPDGCSLNIVMV